MRLFRVALYLKLLNVPQLITLLRRYLNMTTGNLNVPTPNPTLLDTAAKTTALEDGYNALQTFKQQVAQQVDIVKALRKAAEANLVAAGNQIDAIAAGDRAIIESTGLSATDEPEVVHLDQVAELSLTRGDNPGSVDAHWHSMPKADNFTVEISTVAPDIHLAAPWVFYTNSSKSSATISGLQSGSSIWVHVCANGKGQTKGAFSDVAALIVP